MILKYCNRCKTRIGVHTEERHPGEIVTLKLDKNKKPVITERHYCNPCIEIVDKVIDECEINKMDEGYGDKNDA